MTHRFVIMRQGQLETYHDVRAIPLDFDHMIEFRPEVPPGPHSDEQHQEIDAWNTKFQDLMEIERARSHTSR